MNVPQRPLRYFHRKRYPGVRLKNECLTRLPLATRHATRITGLDRTRHMGRRGAIPIRQVNGKYITKNKKITNRRVRIYLPIIVTSFLKTAFFGEKRAKCKKHEKI